MTTDNLPLAGKQIVLGVTGSIAAYKAADLVRLCSKAGADVYIVMTKAATEFITPLTLQTLSGHPVAIELLDADQESAMGHIKLARWADLVLIAPASANTLARLARGEADDLLSALCLATEAPIFIAPAMNNKMWSNQATQTNLALMAQRGCIQLGPESGDQACGENGEGRLMEPEHIVEQLIRWQLPKQLTGKKVVITAGPTHEPIDPVRYIANRSSGKMGFALAEAAVQAGANVTLVAGPVMLPTPAKVSRINVETAQDMFEAVEAETEMDLFIACAAVADYRPAQYQTDKIKKQLSVEPMIQLQQNQDIVAYVANSPNKPFTVGFAAETTNIADYAKTKLQNKNLDMIAANQVGKGLGFASDHNELHVFWPAGEQHLPQAPKTDLARDLMRLIIERYDAKNSA